MRVTRFGRDAYNVLSSPDGRVIYGVGKKVTVYNAETGTPIETLPLHSDASIAISRDGQYFCSRSLGKHRYEIALYKVYENGHELLFTQEIEGDSSTFEEPCFTYDGKWVLNCAGYPTLKLWAINVCTGEKRLLLETEPGFIIGSVMCNKNGIIVFIEERISVQNCVSSGKILHYSDIDSAPRVIDIDKEACATLRAQLNSTYIRNNAVQLSDTQLLIMYAYSGISPETRLQVVDYLNEQFIEPSPTIVIPCGISLRPRISNDGKYMTFVGRAAPGNRKQAFVYNTANWTLVCQYREKYVWNVDFSCDSKTLLVACGSVCRYPLGDELQERM